MENNEKNRIKAELLSQFGYDADFFSIVLAALLEKKFEAMNQKIDSSVNATQEFRDNVQKQIKPVQLTTKGQAFWLYFVPTFALTILTGILLWAGYVFFDFGQEFKHYKYGDEIEQLLEKSDIQIDSLGNKFIVLKPAITLKNAKVGKHYFYNPLVKSITVPISKDN